MNSPRRNPGREGGPMAWRHDAYGITPIGDDGFPVDEAAQHEAAFELTGGGHILGTTCREKE
ncbi:hypothetical protein [Nocardia sp. NPDC051981]|uniref:hypothetical protein n=1 Tax=Nocardia sp. NPDC051981 TaxID=3155417 RepID=UPI00343776BC